MNKDLNLAYLQLKNKIGLPNSINAYFYATGRGYCNLQQSQTQR